MKVVICGMGIAGLSVAHALTKLGVEPVVIGADHGSTARGAGIVSAQFWDRELAPYARRSQEIVSGLVEVNRCGMTQIALSKEMAALLAKIEGVSAGLPRELESELSARFRDRIEGATYSEHDFWIDNHALLSALKSSSRVVQAHVLEIGAGFVRTDRGEFQADCLVLAMGAKMDDASDRRASRLARSGARLSSMFHILDSGVYARPDAGGLLAGDGDEVWPDPDLLPTASPGFLASLEKELGEILPAPAGLTGAGAGVLSFTASRRPIVRPVGKNWLVHAFGGDGLALAPAMAEQVARSIVEGSPQIYF